MCAACGLTSYHKGSVDAQPTVDRWIHFKKRRDLRDVAWRSRQTTYPFGSSPVIRQNGTRELIKQTTASAIPPTLNTVEKCRHWTASSSENQGVDRSHVGAITRKSPYPHLKAATCILQTCFLTILWASRHLQSAPHCAHHQTDNLTMGIQ